MEQEHDTERIIGRDKDTEMLARLAWLLLDAGTSALRMTFDSIHPPLILQEHLKQRHVKSVLKTLHQQRVLTDKHWKLLYPVKNGNSSSQKYDSRLLIISLETICHLCPPYPHGWTNEPLPQDGSLSADIVRLQLLFQDIATHGNIAGEAAYGPLFLQIRDIIVRLGGQTIKMKIARIETELINMEMQQHYIKTLRETWHPNLKQKLEKVHESHTKTSRTLKPYENLQGNDEGLSAEDRVTLKKIHQLLTENVNAEDVIDRLQQSQVIKFSDRQEILGASKKQERMQLLLDKIAQSKLPFALKAFFEAMKFKYKKLYKHVMSVRNEIYKEGVVTTIDVANITREALVNNYKAAFSRVYPFPWSETVYGNIRDIYTPLDIVDSDGRKLHLKEIMPPASRNGRVHRVLLLGPSGSGKSFTSDWLAFMWATQPNYFKNKFEHLLYLNTVSLNGNLETTVYKSLFQEHFKISHNDFWDMLEQDSSRVLLLIDGFDPSQSIDLVDMLTRSRLKQCTVLLTANPNVLVRNRFCADITWFNLGFSDANIKRYFKTCVNLLQLEHNHFVKLYHLAGSESWLLRPYVKNPMLAMTAFITFSTLRSRNMLKEMKTVCDLLDKYGVAMATLYCKSQKIDLIGFEFPDEIGYAVMKLDAFAYTCLIDGRFHFTENEILESTNDDIVMKFGSFTKIEQGSKLKFSCGISMDFLAARYIASLAYDEMLKIVLKNKMITLPKYAQLLSYVCGQYRNDPDSTILRSLFEQLAARHEYYIRDNYFPSPATVAPVDKQVTLSRGKLSDFATSLQCLAECPGRIEFFKIIAPTFPQRLIMKDEVMMSLIILQDLLPVFGDPECAIKEVHLELHQYHYQLLPLILQLAKTIGNCHSIHSMQITWSSLDTMSSFIAAVIKVSQSIDTLVLIEDHRKKTVKFVSAATWATLQSACSYLTLVRHFSFLQARVPTTVNYILQYLPTCIPYVSFNGSCFNLMCAGQFACHLHDNTSIRFVDIGYTKLNSSEFIVIFQGMQMCEGIQTVRMCGIHLDRPCIIALCEYIKLTHALEVLDMSDCDLNTEMCIRLVGAIKLNRTLTRLIVSNARISSDGRRVISSTKTKVRPVHVEGLANIIE